MSSMIPSRILVPSDFSSVADNARVFAASLAGSFPAELHGVHVQVLPETPLLSDGDHQEIVRLLGHGDSRRTEALRAEADGAAPPPFEPHLVRAMSAAEAIAASSADLGCDLVVMGTHGRKGLKHFFLGSVAEEVVKTAPVPVITVRPEVTVDERKLRRILVPHDFSEHSAAALELAAAWARHLHSQLILLHVIEPVAYPDFYAVDLMPQDLTERLRERSIEALNRIANEELPDVDTHTVVAAGLPGDAIVEEAAAADVDLVVMGTRGLTAVKELLLGSVAEAVIRRSPAPLLSTRKR